MKIPSILVSLFAAFSLSATALSEDTKEKPVHIAIESLPPAVRDAIASHTQGSTMLGIVRTSETFGVRLDSHGQKAELRVDESGKQLRIRSKKEAEQQYEEEQQLARAGKLNTIALKDVPQAARDIIKTLAGDAVIEQIIKSPSCFLVSVDHAGEKQQMRFAADGQYLQ